MSFLHSVLPLEIWTNICIDLATQDLISMTKVSKQAYTICVPLLWRSLVHPQPENDQLDNREYLTRQTYPTYPDQHSTAVFDTQRLLQVVDGNPELLKLIRSMHFSIYRKNFSESLQSCIERLVPPEKHLYIGVECFETSLLDGVTSVNLNWVVGYMQLEELYSVFMISTLRKISLTNLLYFDYDLIVTQFDPQWATTSGVETIVLFDCYPMNLELETILSWPK